ncbi:glycosyltransferase family 2 protein [Microbacterium hydrocarbonoxydans]|uniref:glycosyltransferase family 2 protein n=1 Tax=Microbacterium hydrocarbonoxydans TaxID=273678 RepID=UPI002040FA75|nr:glycosyltransferase [Microbacterium hydrocarbonoxydans]MCM3781272.1 glycosyltransferase [Microbacterium hydrocarbonoxydans]
MFPILNAFTVLLGVAFVTYVTFILIPYLRYPKVVPGNPDDFEWHFFIPCRDEEAVIETTVTRARRDFPGAHVWVIDDDSEDATAEIVTRFAEVDPQVHLVQRRRPEARTGKGDALNAAYHQLLGWLPAEADPERVIVVVIDADGEMEPNALEVCSADDIFGDPEVGAAQIAVWMKNRDDAKPYPQRGRLANAFARYLLRMQDLEFRTTIAAMQSLRAKTGTVGLGGNGQFTRLSVLDAIGAQYGEPWHGALLEDYELGVHVVLAGYQVKHVYDTQVHQEALPSIRRLLTQRTRWAQGNIQCVKYIGEVVKSRHIDSAGVIETTYYLILPFLQMLGGLAFAILVGAQVNSWIHDPALFHAAVNSLFGIAGLMAMFSIAPFAIWGFVYKVRCEPQASWLTALGWGIGVWLYVYYMYICIARAFLRIVRGKNGWSKTRRNAEAHVYVGGSVAVEV